MLLIATFVKPCVQLLKVHPKTRPKYAMLQNALRTLQKTILCQNPDPKDAYKQTLQRVASRRNELMRLMLNMLTILVFGAEVPILLCVAPLFSWLNFCMNTWLEHMRMEEQSSDYKRRIAALTVGGKNMDVSTRRDAALSVYDTRQDTVLLASKAADEPKDCNAAEDAFAVCPQRRCCDSARSLHFATRVAENVLSTQPPAALFLLYAHGGCWLVKALLMLDLRFRQDVVISWTVMSLVISIVNVRKMREAESQKARGGVFAGGFGGIGGNDTMSCSNQKQALGSLYWDKFKSSAIGRRWFTRDAQLTLLREELGQPLVEL